MLENLLDIGTGAGGVAQFCRRPAPVKQHAVAVELVVGVEQLERPVEQPAGDEVLVALLDAQRGPLDRLEGAIR